MTYSEIKHVINNRKSMITLNRPSRLNAYTPDMGDEIIAAFREDVIDSNVDVIILKASGKGFCAGADKDFLLGNKVSKKGIKLGKDEFITSFVRELSKCPKPLVAVVNGVAVGIGVTMILPFDIRIASEEASFSFPFTKLGILPGLGSSYYLPALVGASKAKELVLTGSTIDAHEALRIGLVNKVVASKDLVSTLDSISKEISASNQKIISLAKEMFNDLDANLDVAIQREKEFIKDALK
ncbi:uncharacterized protein METZ01_LOCUS176804 [marine metagenome]|uniref:Enoyl-CoA hydratase n=1 Tax=marine metagenome TaxID=408172 RepID=A0A382CD36_9ZZZZ|tara:strand:- start:1423 stop:2142 length:720 start_codon:yes stop_codon:yes gene_type:complete